MPTKRGRPGARRIRTIKPEILSDAKTRQLSDRDWRLFVSTFVLADDEGRFEADAHVVGPDVFGYAATKRQVDEALLRLHGLGLIELWTHGTRRLGRVCGWAKHQRLEKPSPSLLPASDAEGSSILPGAFADYSPNVPGKVAEGSAIIPGGWEGMGKEGTGRVESAAAPRPPLAESSTSVLRPCCSPPVNGDRVQAVAWRFCQLHQERLGAPYPHGRRDAAAINALPESYTAELLADLVEPFFSTSDRFISERRGFKIPVFVDNLSALLKTRQGAVDFDDVLGDE